MKKQTKQKLTTFPSGAVRSSSEGKELYVDTISWTALKLYSQYLSQYQGTYGTEKTSFKIGIPEKSYEESLMRHVQKYMENKYEFGMTELPNIQHVSAIIFNAFGILHEYGMAEKRKLKKKSK